MTAGDGPMTAEDRPVTSDDLDRELEPPDDLDPDAAPAEEGAIAVFKNRPFLLLWLSQAATQIGGNMVIFGLTVIISKSTGSVTAVSALILTFLVPAVVFSAVAGVYVDRLDRRLVLTVTNALRGAAFVAVFLVGDNLVPIYLLNLFISTVTVFFAPAEAAMIPMVVPRRQLLAANGVFTLTLNAAFALGFALIGPLIVKIAGPQALIILVAGPCRRTPAAALPSSPGRRSSRRNRQSRASCGSCVRGSRTSGPTARSAGRLAISESLHRSSASSASSARTSPV